MANLAINAVKTVIWLVAILIAMDNSNGDGTRIVAAIFATGLPLDASLRSINARLEAIGLRQIERHEEIKARVDGLSDRLREATNRAQ